MRVGGLIDAELFHVASSSAHVVTIGSLVLQSSAASPTSKRANECQRNPAMIRLLEPLLTGGLCQTRPKHLTLQYGVH